MTDESRWAIIYCPKSRTKSSHKLRRQVERCLHESGVAYDLVQSEDASSVSRLVTMMINNDYKTIIIFGSDTALCDAVNCLMQTERNLRDTIALGTIPNGGLCDFAHYWGIDDDDIESTVASLKTRRIRRVDLGCVKYKDAAGATQQRYFLNCVNIGLVAMIGKLRRVTTHAIGIGAHSYVVSLIQLLFKRLDFKMHFHINSETVKRNITSVCVGNARGYGQTPNAVPYNGHLDVSVVHHAELTQLFEGIYLYVRGQFLNHKSIQPYRTRKITFYSTGKAPVNVDGREIESPSGEYDITVEHEAVNFLIP